MFADEDAKTPANLEFWPKLEASKQETIANRAFVVYERASSYIPNKWMCIIKVNR